MDTKLLIGNDQADILQDITCEYSVNDIRTLQMGSQQSSYDIMLPLTSNNKKILKFSNQLNIKDELSAEGKIYFKETEVFKGKVIQVGSRVTEAHIIIKANSWADPLETVKLKDLDLSANDLAFTSANVVASWTAAAGAFMRFPLVYYGLLAYKDPLGGNNDQWYANDFTPWFNIRTIFLACFAPLNVVSTFCDSAFFKSLYMLARESFLHDTSYLSGKAFTASPAGSDNTVTVSYPAGTTSDTILSKSPAVFTSGTETDEGDDFTKTTGIYTVPESGTYRFYAAIDHTITYSLLTKNSASFAFSIRNGSTAIVSVSGAVEPSGTYILDTGFQHFSAGNQIKLYTSVTINLTNGSGTPRSCIIGLAATTVFKTFSTWPANQGIGIGKTIVVSDWMPDVSQADFVQAVKNMFNLQFFYDGWNKTLYIEPADTFHTANTIPVETINTREAEHEFISQNYSKSIKFKFNDDNADIALSGANSLITPLTTGEHNITLNSLYAKEGSPQEFKNNLFSTFIKDIPHYVMGYGPSVPKIWLAGDNKANYIPTWRGTGYGTKIGAWAGYNAGTSWKYEGVTKTSYPQMDALDYPTLFNSYYLKTFHQIDGGRILRIEIKPSLNFLQQFTTIVSDGTKEGFRAGYVLTYEGETYLAILNRITFNGPRALLELIIL
jgi:hypothetical protein